ncbi:MAG: hypothetical protein R3F11_20180 [Verrucomicrobiales bacterium]
MTTLPSWTLGDGEQDACAEEGEPPGEDRDRELEQSAAHGSRRAHRYCC